MKFKHFLESIPEDLLNQINEILAEMSEEEINDFGFVLYYEFFEDEETEDDNYDDFTLEDVNEMIKELGPDFYDDVLDLLQDEDIDLDDETDLEDKDLEEGVTRKMLMKNYNRKNRKYMSLTKSKYRQQKQARKKAARVSRQARKRYYKANRMKIAAYQKSRRDAIKKGKHKVKIRKSS